MRRRPEACIYCEAPAASEEHIIPESIGGRLTAPILCERHNNEIGARTDAALFERLRPLVNLLRIKRQDGRIGADFVARTDDGEPIVVTADGRIPGPRLVVAERDATKRIMRASGDLALLDQLQAQGAFSPATSGPVIAVPSKPPIVNFDIVSDRFSEAAALKIALHFVAGFAADIPRALADSLLPALLGDEPHTDALLRTPLFDDILFPLSWPPEHRITCWAEADAVFVAILLFDAQPYLCRLPMRARFPVLRYRQPLLNDPSPIFETNIDAVATRWDMPISRERRGRWRSEIVDRLDRILAYGKGREIRDQCERAARRASKSMTDNGGDFFDWYRGALQLELLPSEEVDRYVRLGKTAQMLGRNVWDFQIIMDRGAPL